MISRHAASLVEATLADTPVTVIQGARQVGKSTLARQVIAARGVPLLSLDTDTVYDAARADPGGFARQRSDALLAIDEIQRAPELLRAIKGAVDQDRRPGRFLITGSANLLQLPGAQESLAGRAETVPSYGLSQGELAGNVERFLDFALAGDSSSLALSSQLARDDYLDIICAGSYPEARTRSAGRRAAWFDNYLTRVVSRDARDVSGLAHLDRLPALVRLIAANNATELVKSRLARDSGIPETSLSGYIELLETLYLIHRLPAWAPNLTKRETGRPKLALLDTGLAARLINLPPRALHPGVVSNHAGGLFEAFVAGELRRQCAWAQSQPQLFHFRDRDGIEVDIIIESADRLVVGVDVKAAVSVSRSDFRGLTFLRDRLGERFKLGVLLYAGTDPVPFGDRLWALPVASIWA
jgi:predicted AAA+ superfamily ATPase